MSFLRTTKFLFTLTLAVLLFLKPGQAQDQEPSFDLVVGVPFSFDFGQGLSDIPTEDGISFTFSFTATNLPPGLTLSSSGLLSGTPTTAGTFATTLTFSFTITADGQTFPFTYPFDFPLTVRPNGNGGKPTVDPGGLTFSFSQSNATPTSQTITVSNPNSQAQTITASVTSSGGQNFLSVSPSASAPAFGSASIVVTANPSGLTTGTYSGLVSISVSPSGAAFSIPVVVTISSDQKSIRLSQSGLRFQAVQGGGAPASQSISVLNGGAGSLSFSASASTLSGGGWLSVTGGGTATSVAPATLTATANASGLAPGNYYGQITLTADGASNSPQIVSVVLNVVTPANSPGASLSTSGLIFVTAAGAATTTAKTVTVTNPSPSPLMFAISTSSQNGPAPFTATASSTSVVAGQPATVSVKPNPGLAKGVYFGEVDLLFTDPSSPTNSVIQRIAVVLVVIPAPGGSSLSPVANSEPRASGCTPSQLIPVFTQLGSGFKVVAGWPVPIEVTVVDDCGNFLINGGSVMSTFSSGDPALSLTSLNDGRWSATWQPAKPSPQVTIVAKALEIQPALQGTQQIGGTLQANASVPVIAPGGTVSAASNQATPLAPGSFISIYGSNFSSGVFQSPQLPFSTTLAGTQVLLAGRPLPLYFATGGQINAVVPYDVPSNTSQQLIVQQNTAISVPQPVTIAPAQPAIFTQDNSGTGPGAILVAHADGSVGLTGSGNPAQAGDVLVIYCAGLGEVSPSIAAGTAAPASPLSATVNPVAVTIGGVAVQPQFAGLAPGFAGLYQVNVQVPSGITPGSNTQVTISVSGQTSPPVTIVTQ